MEDKKKFTTKGMNLDDLLNITYNEINGMNTTDLRKLVSRLALVANKRLRHEEHYTEKKTGEKNTGVSPSYHMVMKNYLHNRKKKAFISKGLDRNQLRRELSHIDNYLNAETSGVKKFNAYRKYMNEKYHIPMDLNKSREFWKYIDMLRERSTYMNGIFTSERCYNAVNDYMKEKTGSPEEQYEDLMKYMKYLYEHQEEAERNQAINNYYETHKEESDSDSPTTTALKIYGGFWH